MWQEQVKVDEVFFGRFLLVQKNKRWQTQPLSWEKVVGMLVTDLKCALTEWGLGKGVSSLLKAIF